MSYRYRVLPFQGQIKAGAAVSAVSAKLESAINQEASQGWEFCTLNSVNIEVSPGCLAGLFGARTAYIAYDQLIFRRPATDGGK